MKRIERLTYRFKLSFIVKIYNVVLIMHFKLIIIATSDSYKRCFIILLFIIIDNEKEYKIERLIKK